MSAPAASAGPPLTGMALDLEADDAAFEARYGEVRRVLRRALRLQPWTRLADRVFGRLEDLALGARVRRPLDRPVFVTGAYRSGTTMLERILARHPDVGSFDHLSFAFPTAPFLAGLLRRLRGEGRAAVAPDQPNLDLTNGTPAECEPIWLLCRGNCWSDRPSHVLGADFSDPRFERLFLASAQKHLARAGRTRFMNKNPLATLRVGYLAKLFPDARFVHVARHPHRVVRSQLDLERMWARVLPDRGVDWARAFADAFMPPGRHFPRTAHAEEIERVRSSDPALAVALSVADFERAFRDAVAAGGLERRVLRVRHEDLLERFRREMRRVFRHAELADEGAEAVIAAAERDFLDRGLPSRTSPLPRFGAEAEAVLAPLVRRGGYPPVEAGDGGEA